MVLQCLQDVQADIDRLEAAAEKAVKKPLMFAREAQFHTEGNTAKTRAASSLQVGDKFSVVFRPIESVSSNCSVPIVTLPRRFPDDPAKTKCAQAHSEGDQR